VVGQTEENVAEASSVTLVAGRTSVSTPSTSLTTEGAIPEVEPPWKGSALLGADLGLSQALVHVGGDLHAWGGPTLQWADRRNSRAMLFTLDDVMEAGH
jgi:hypothetical protein